MMCTAYFGELNEKRKNNWNCTDSNPYDVLIEPICLSSKGHKLLDLGDDYFYERIQIDWGSYAWKCSTENILCFLEDVKATLPWLINRDLDELEKVKSYIRERGNTQYGVVFIEEY